ncbi:MAG: DUF2808 domain-containing protein [Gloeobacterales cyanobacterium]
MRTRLFGAIALCVLVFGAPVAPLMAQSGFMLTGPKDRDTVLTYRLRNDRARAQLNSMDMYVPAQKVAIRQLQIILPDGYSGSLDPSRVKLSNKDTGADFPLEDASYEKEDLTLTLSIKDPVPAGTPLSIHFSNIVNPDSGGMYRIRARALGTERNPVFRFIGDWYVSIN